MDHTPLGETLDDFSRDVHTDQEIAIWEAMARAFSGFVIDRKPSPQAQAEAYSLLLERSGIPTEEVLRRNPLKVLSVAEADDLLQRYVEPPRPIVVERQSHQAQVPK